MLDLAVVIPAMNEAHWLRALLPTIAAHRGAITCEAIVADIESTDETRAVVSQFPFARIVPVVNRGFAHANNAAVATTDARYVLYLNADTEIKAGTLADLVAVMDQRPTIGLAGVKQVTQHGVVYPTMRRFASPQRRFAEALWSERLAPSRGLRVLDLALYDRDMSCDWTMGSFMLVRREALESAGWLDERFFFSAEEQDLCRRIRAGGWDVRHLPQMTIMHHVGKREANPRFAQQYAHAEMQYAAKHFGLLGRRAYQAALASNHLVRLCSPSAARRKAARAALAATLGRVGSPFMEAPETALPPRLFGAGELRLPPNQVEPSQSGNE